MPNENVKTKADARLPRNSSFELLRIISIVMIIFHHFAVHSGFKWGASSLPIAYFWCNFFSMGGKIGVNAFVLISGYFLANREDPVFNFKRILKLWGQIFFYSAAAWIFASVVIGDQRIPAVIKVFFPIASSSWWFASAYFVLFLIHPFLNKLIACLDKKTYQSLLVLLVTCWCIIPTLTGSDYQGNDLAWFITLYAIAGYARIYGLNPKLTSKHYFIFFVIFSALTYLSGLVWGTYYYEQDEVPILLISLALFMTFATLKMNYHRWINVVASATFGVYLIHDSDFVRPFLWLDLFRSAQYQNSPMIIPYSIAAVAAVFIVCTLIDLVRQQIIERPYMRLVNACADSWLKPFERVCEFLKQIFFGK